MATVYQISSPEASHIECVDRTDNIGTEEAPDLVCYFEAWCITKGKAAGSVSSDFLGNFTNKSLSESYSPVNPVDPCDLGEEAELTPPLPFCDETGKNFYGIVNLSIPEIVYAFDATNSIVVPVGEVTPGHCSPEIQTICLK